MYGLKRRSSISRVKVTQKQKEGFNVEFEIWLIDSTKRWQSGPTTIIILYSYPNSRPRSWSLEVIVKSTQRLLATCLPEVSIEFNKLLMNKNREVPDCRVIICGAEYGSKTCSDCGVSSPPILEAQKCLKCAQYNQKKSDKDFQCSKHWIQTLVHFISLIVIISKKEVKRWVVYISTCLMIKSSQNFYTVCLFVPQTWKLSRVWRARLAIIHVNKYLTYVMCCLWFHDIFEK